MPLRFLPTTLIPGKTPQLYNLPLSQSNHNHNHNHNRLNLLIQPFQTTGSQTSTTSWWISLRCTPQQQSKLLEQPSSRLMWVESCHTTNFGGMVRPHTISGSINLLT